MPNSKNMTRNKVGTARSLLIVLAVVIWSTTMGTIVPLVSETRIGDWGSLVSPVDSPVLNENISGPIDSSSEATDPLYTLVVVRCNGDMRWLNEVPSDWRIVVYEKCVHHQHTNFSVTTAMHAGAEECNGYLDYIYDYYYNLTMVTIFFHEDGLIPYTKPDRAQAVKEGREWYHTGFYNFSEVVDATKEFLTPQQPFLHFGTGTLIDIFGMDQYHGAYEKVLWPFFRSEILPQPPKEIIFKPSAHMAVRKEAILQRSRETYGAILQQARYSRDVDSWQDSRPLCCAMERMWHMLFGQPPKLPKSAMVYEILKERKG